MLAIASGAMDSGASPIGIGRLIDGALMALLEIENRSLTPPPMARAKFGDALPGNGVILLEHTGGTEIELADFVDCRDILIAHEVPDQLPVPDFEFVGADRLPLTKAGHHRRRFIKFHE